MLLGKRASFKSVTMHDGVVVLWDLSNNFVFSKNDIGTLGSKCNNHMVIPHLMENYEVSKDPTEKQAVNCTVHSFSLNFDHCLRWARSEFESLFEKTLAVMNAIVAVSLLRISMITGLATIDAVVLSSVLGAIYGVACDSVSSLFQAMIDPLESCISWCNICAILFCKNLDPFISCLHLEGIFCRFGIVFSCKVAGENDKIKGFRFVWFDSEESAMTATIALHGTILEGTKLYVSKFVKKSEKIVGAVKKKFTNLYMKIFVDNMTGDLLEEIFYKYEKSYSIVGMKDSNGMSKGFGFGCLSSLNP